MTTSKSHQAPLRALADIKPGYPFRGAIRHDPKGEVSVVQVRHLDPEYGFGEGCQAGALDRVTLEGRRKPDYLQSGDILFVSRGARFFAVVVPHIIPDHTVCTPHFFLIRLNESAKAVITPEFLAWQINHHEAQSYLTRLGQGTLQHSISKSQLKDLPVTIPSLHRQSLVTSLHRAALDEAEQLRALIANREQEMRALGMAVLSEARASGQAPVPAQNDQAAAGHP
ncbi:hypothetical protein [Halomonas sp.]|uniref:hypothetical protein n=1 Tax=Halomonas sp. TaxID=1486246 RepID=UPI00298E8697|nr:hypothetical protein [Halomonas sp.]MDW7746834.1 hypothetical protein [Halomonas sp.]